MDLLGNFRVRAEQIWTLNRCWHATNLWDLIQGRLFERVFVCSSLFLSLSLSLSLVLFLCFLWFLSFFSLLSQKETRVTCIRAC